MKLQIRDFSAALPRRPELSSGQRAALLCSSHEGLVHHSLGRGAAARFTLVSLADSPTAPPFSPNAPSATLSAGPLRRGAAWIVDFAAATVIAAVPTAPLGSGHVDDILGFSTLLAVWYLYLVVLESTWHKTLGQRVAGVSVRGPDGAPCRWRESLRRNITKALLTPWAGALIVTLVAPNGPASDSAAGIAMLGLLVGLLAAAVLMRRDPFGRSVGDRLAGTVVVRRACRAELERRVPAPVAIHAAAFADQGDWAVVPVPVGRVRRPRVRLATSPWGLREVALASMIGLGPFVATNLLKPFHLSLTATLGASTLVLLITVLQDGWFVGWAWGFSLRRYGLGLADWGFRRPGLAVLWLVPLGLLICVAVEFAQAPFVPGPTRDIGDLFPHTAAGGLLLVLVSCVVAPVMEEAFYRGFLFRGLLKACRPWWAAIISAALFAAMHWELTNFVPVFVAGLVLAWLYYRTNSLWTSIALHASFNSIAFIAWLLM